MKHHTLKLATLALAATAAVSAQAQSNVTVYGRVDLSIAQQADAAKNLEVRNGSGSRLGFRGTEDLGGGLKAVFHIEHRFNAQDGSVGNTSRFWEGKAIVGVQGAFGRVSLGREENPAYSLSQGPADPWGTDTVASNGSIVAGRIGSTRYSNSINYRYDMGGFSVGAQMAENIGGQKRPYSLGAAYKDKTFVVGLGYENPTDSDDDWTTVNGEYNFGMFKAGAFFGTGKNTSAQKHQAWMLSGKAMIGAGEARLSYGQLKNTTTNVVADKQMSLGYHYALSKRTTVYADLTTEKRDAFPSNREKTGYDFGIKHNF